MKKLTLFLFIILAFATLAKAQGKFGLGIILGEPTGISGKYHLSNTSSIDGAVAWSFIDYGALHIHGDYLYNFTWISPEVPAYVGIGGRIKSGSEGHDAAIAVRVPVGIVWEPPTTPIDLFVELVPMLDLTPSTDFRINAAIGIRYYFP